jgi:hypothetical protein
LTPTAQVGVGGLDDLLGQGFEGARDPLALALQPEAEGVLDPILKVALQVGHAGAVHLGGDSLREALREGGQVVLRGGLEARRRLVDEVEVLVDRAPRVL